MHHQISHLNSCSLSIKNKTDVDLAPSLAQYFPVPPSASIPSSELPVLQRAASIGSVGQVPFSLVPQVTLLSYPSTALTTHHHHPPSSHLTRIHCPAFFLPPLPPTNHSSTLLHRLTSLVRWNPATRFISYPFSLSSSLTPPPLLPFFSLLHHAPSRSKASALC